MAALLGVPNIKLCSYSLSLVSSLVKSDQSSYKIKTPEIVMLHFFVTVNNLDLSPIIDLNWLQGDDDAGLPKYIDMISNLL